MINYSLQLTDDVPFKKFKINFIQIGDFVRIYYYIFVEDELKRISLNGLCLAIYNKGINSSVLLRNFFSKSLVDYKVFIFGRHILKITTKKRFRKQGFLRKKMYFKKLKKNIT
tara:strand:+ start:176 stop:514 length:339 start_codon:yes stop_codon:yes gene_type:complete